MTKSRSSEKVAGPKRAGPQKVPKVGRFAMGDVQKRVRGSRLIYDNRDDLAAELLNLGSSKITDIVDILEDAEGRQSVRLKPVKDIPDSALRAIKKIKVTPGRDGDMVEVELIDKVRVLQMLAKAGGLLEAEKEVDKPSVVSIEMVMPKGDGDG
jgi:hypothetical protein|tara:strand:- start:353 stop:814 length:462 start_codon:yes stop_codon:yes gene_type:complete